MSRSLPCWLLVLTVLASGCTLLLKPAPQPVLDGGVDADAEVDGESGPDSDMVDADQADADEVDADEVDADEADADAIDGDQSEGDADAGVDGVVQGEILATCLSVVGDVWSVEVPVDGVIRIAVDTIAAETAADFWAFISPEEPPFLTGRFGVLDANHCTYEPPCEYIHLCPVYETSSVGGLRYIFVGLEGTIEACCGPGPFFEYQLSVWVNGVPAPIDFVLDDLALDGRWLSE